MYYHVVIIMKNEICDCNDFAHQKFVLDRFQETNTQRVQSRENKEYIPRKRNRIPPSPRHHKWLTGRSPVIIHR